MTTNSSLVVPMVMWGGQAPTHCISAVYVLRDQKTLVTGASDGQVILWNISEEWSKITPRHLLIGHSSPVKCIAKTSAGSEAHTIVTTSENGEIFSWDTVDGRCMENKKVSSQVHTFIQAYHSPDSSRVRLFCCGFYEEIIVLDPFTLERLFSLSSRSSPDWISAFHIIRPRNRSDDVVLGLTSTGIVKVWTLTGKEEEEEKDFTILENESKQIRCNNASTLSTCAYNMRTVLVVCSTYWNVYDAGDFTCLLSVPCKRGERWIGGEFISADKVATWSDDGKGYLYQLPTNCIVESKDFHNRSKKSNDPDSMLLCTLELQARKTLDCSPAFRYTIFSNPESKTWKKYLIAGYCDGSLAVWKVPDSNFCTEMKESKENRAINPFSCTSLEEVWSKLETSPPGVLNQLGSDAPVITSTIFLPSQCRLVCGRDDGSIIMVPATQTIMMHLLSGKHQNYTNWPQKQVLIGHSARINALLYPNNEHPRYDVSHLVSGSVDFSVCLWDIYTGSLIHRFSSHGGEVLSLYVPPPNCSPRIQLTICSVASDNSVTLLSLKEKKCILLASKHLFPVSIIKWRPLDDYLIVGCSDRSTYVWQMETGHLDRVVHGHAGDEILQACDENTTTVNLGESVGANPALHFFRGLRHRNLAAMKIATQSGINQLQGNRGSEHAAIQEKIKSYPLVINGFRTNPRDPEGHILFFDVEGLIVQLLSEEYTAMSPGTMETQGFTNQKDYDRIWALTKPASPDTVKKISGFLNKVKDRADDRLNSISSTASPETQKKLTGFMSKVKEGAEKAKEELEAAKREIEKRAGALDNEDNGDSLEENGSVRPSSLHLEINLTLEIGQLLLSLLHAWGLDIDLDKSATAKLGLLRPKQPVSYGILSRGGDVMSLVLPTWSPPGPFTSVGHWELSHTITTDHLLSVISITNTLLSISNASFIPEQERKRKLVRQATHGAMELPSGPSDFSHQQKQIQNGWSSLSNLHCLLISNKVTGLGSKSFKKPLVDLLAIRWQDRCLQIRLGAQELLVAELKRLGPDGRKHLVEIWASYLPRYGDPPFDTPSSNGGSETTSVVALDDDELEDDPDVQEARRNTTTSVILMGVIGAVFDLKDPLTLGTQMTRLTAKALMYLVLAPKKSNASLRRAAIDLIGRGFVLWEPHLEVSKVLLGLLENTCEADWWVPSNKYGLPLTPSGDSCRTSRHALLQISRVRPGAFITSIAREVARFNNLALNAQTLNVNIQAHVLAQSKGEILHLVEKLIETNKADLMEYLTDVADIILHCIDNNHLKNKSMGDIFPPLSAFPQISHCMQTRRLAVGTKTGSLAMYELRASKIQTLGAHSGSVTAVCFSPDGKHLATYSSSDNKISFWTTSTGMFGLGNAQTKCTKSYSALTQPKINEWSPNHLPKLVWISGKTVTLLLPDGSESRFNA